jgi:ATP-dependent Lhr-like helicase
VLLRRYGVVCWRLLEREAAWLPPWRELVRVYRRLEARGEIRGGRFISGIPGEQFALPEAVAALRGVRRDDANEPWIVVAANDPANLLGNLLPGDKVARVPGNRVLFSGGLPIAVLVAHQVTFLTELTLEAQSAAKKALHMIEPLMERMSG